MAIGITGKGNRPISGLAGNSKSGKAKAAYGGGSKTGAARSGGSGDTMSVSDSAAQLQALEARIAALPVVDAGLVEDIQNQLSTGNYEVQPEETADKLLEQEKELASRD